MQNPIDIREFKDFPQFKENFMNKLPENAFKEGCEDECWEWNGTINNSVGYGTISWGRGSIYLAHRISYIIFKGLIPYGKIIRHTCDNPFCVNPKHLILGSHKENSIDSVQRNRQAHQKLNEEAVKVIKWMLKYKPKRGLASKLAKLHNVDRTTIGHINTGKTWAWVKV